MINIDDAEAAVATVARFDVFQLAGAWMKGDALRVSRLLDGLEEEGEEPVLLLWAVAEDIRTLIRLTAALKQGQNIQSLRNSLRLWGDKQTLAPMAAKRISINRLLDALKTCAKIDRIIKGRGRRRCMDRVQTTRYLAGWLETVTTYQETCTQYAPKQKIL